MQRILIGVRERVVQLRISETPRVMGLRERQQGGLTAGELEQGGTHAFSVAHPAQRCARPCGATRFS